MASRLRLRIYGVAVSNWRLPFIGKGSFRFGSGARVGVFQVKAEAFQR
jgi:hypothetical protein